MTDQQHSNGSYRIFVRSTGDPGAWLWTLGRPGSTPDGLIAEYCHGQALTKRGAVWAARRRMRALERAAARRERRETIDL